MSLYHERIYRIVPPGQTPSDPDDIKALVETGLIGTKLDPVPYAKEASEIFLDKLDYWNAAALSSDEEDRKDLTRIHSSKVDQQVRDLFKDLGYRTNDDWFTVPTEVASNYMLFLATHIAQKNQLSLLTDNIVPWTATTYFNADGRFGDFSRPLDDLKNSKDGAYLFGLILQGLVPVNIAEISSEKIAEFREKRRIEIARMKEKIDSLQAEIRQVDASNLIADKLFDCVKDVNSAIEEYQRSADVIKAKGWFGVQMFGVPSSALTSKIFNITDTQTAVLIGTGIALGAIYSIAATKSELRKLNQSSPYSALALMQKEFKNVTSQRGGGDLSFKAYNCLEEYVND